MKKLEPIIYKGLFSKKEQELFQPEVVRDYIKNPTLFSKKYDHPSRHYSQSIIEFKPEVIKKIFKRLSIEPDDKTVTVFGGYTGQFADCLQEIGFKVIFTDPIAEYVDRARKKGMESYCYYLEEIPAEIIERTDLFATFECYPPFFKNAIYSILRLLSVPDGLIFVESIRTLEELENEKTPIQIESYFEQYSINYDVKIRTIGNAHSSPRCNDIKIHHFHIKGKNHKIIYMDCAVMKYLYMINPGILIMDADERFQLADNFVYSEESLERIASIYCNLMNEEIQQYRKEWFMIFDREFHLPK